MIDTETMSKYDIAEYPKASITTHNQIKKEVEK